MIKSQILTAIHAHLRIILCIFAVQRVWIKVLTFIESLDDYKSGQSLSNYETQDIRVRSALGRAFVNGGLWNGLRTYDSEVSCMITSNLLT